MFHSVAECFLSVAECFLFLVLRSVSECRRVFRNVSVFLYVS